MKDNLLMNSLRWLLHGVGYGVTDEDNLDGEQRMNAYNQYKTMLMKHKSDVLDYIGFLNESIAMDENNVLANASYYEQKIRRSELQLELFKIDLNIGAKETYVSMYKNKIIEEKAYTDKVSQQADKEMDGLISNAEKILGADGVEPYQKLKLTGLLNRCYNKFTSTEVRNQTFIELTDLCNQIIAKLKQARSEKIIHNTEIDLSK